MFISVEGVDRVGKDSFLIALDKKTKWHTCNMMRGPAGCLTYDKIYNRETKERYNEALSVAQAIKSTKHLIIYLYAEVATIKSRLEDEIAEGGSGYFAPPEWSIKDVLDLYEKNIDFLYSKDEVIKINTTWNTIDEEVDLVIKKIEEIRNTNPNYIEDNNANFIESPNKGEFEYKQYLPFMYSFTKTELSNKPIFNINVDKPYYEMLDKTLYHLLYEYKLGWINERQIIYTSKDCIPLVQILLGNKIQIFVHQRSCDVEKHQLNDIMFFYDFCIRNFKDTDFVIHYTCAVPHKYIYKG